MLEPRRGRTLVLRVSLVRVRLGGPMDSTLNSVELSALTEGVKFLYAQAGELLTRRRAARDRAAEEQRSAPEDLVAPLDPPGTAFALPEHRAAASLAVVDAKSGELLRARQAVEAFLLGDASDLSSDQRALLAVERLRSLLEEVYGVSLTFAHEDRARHKPSDSPPGGGVVVQGSVHGDMAGRDFYKTVQAPGA